ncbi:MAG: hypothetical protein IT361_14820 [Gemmatimonadaceae bacterium]|nr:hypothetical protein [Gemmatimonadaceae bacterium]
MVTAPASLRAVLERLLERMPSLRRVEESGASLEIALARIERPETRPARLLEGVRLRAHAVPRDVPAAFTAFLDGVQRSREVAWIGTMPVVYGRVAAVVRERIDGRLVTWRGAPRQGAALYAPWSRLSTNEREAVASSGVEAREVAPEAAGDGGEVHPLRALQDAANAVTQDREVIERDLAADFCAAGEGTVYLDGGLPTSDVVHASARAVGVVKSHQTLYVAESDLATVFGLGEAERSSVLIVEHRRRRPVATWYLRLRDARQRDPFWGLVRVEIPLADFERGGASLADERSAWVVAERSPVALPDGRWDTMSYGIRNCEEFLRATMGR